MLNIKNKVVEYIEEIFISFSADSSSDDKDNNKQ